MKPDLEKVIDEAWRKLNLPDDVAMKTVFTLGFVEGKKIGYEEGISHLRPVKCQNEPIRDST